MFGANEMFQDFNFDSKRFKWQKFLLSRFESRRHRKGEDFHALRFYDRMNTEFIPFRKFARDAVQVFMQYSYRMNNNGRVVGGGAS